MWKLKWRNGAVVRYKSNQSGLWSSKEAGNPWSQSCSLKWFHINLMEFSIIGNSIECCQVSTLICSICKAKSRIFCHILSKFTHLQNRGTGSTHKVSSFSLSYWNIDSTLHCSYLKSTVQCSYNAIQYIMIFHTLLHWLTQDINTTFN